jgi:hypothetical protein
LEKTEFPSSTESLLENGQLAAHICRMAERDQWTENLKCPRCGKTGSAELSQTNGQAFHDGDQAVRVDHVSEGSKAVQFEYGSNFYLLFLRQPGRPLMGAYFLRCANSLK